jgi:hypothetical protein
LNKFTLIKKQELESLSKGEIAYYYNEYILINKNKNFFKTIYSNLKPITSGIYNIYLSDHLQESTILHLYPYLEIKNNFTLLFKNEDLDLTFKYTVIDKSGECDIDTLPDIINGEFTCNKCEYYDPLNTFLHYGSYCEKTCQDYKFLYNEKGCVSNCEEYNLVLYNNKCYKQCPENSGLIAENSSVCYNCAELGKSKVNNFCKKCTGNECIEEIYDDELIDDEPEEEEIIEEDTSKLCDNYLCYNSGRCRIIDNVAKCYCTNKYTGDHCETKIQSEEEKRMNSLIDIFLESTNVNGQIENLDFSVSSNHELIEELTKYFSNPTLVANIEKDTQKKIIHSVDTIIMRVVDGVTIAKNSNVMKLIDLSLNLNLSILKNKGILRLRLLQENSEEEEEEVKKIKELLDNGIEIYKRMIFEDIHSNNYDKDKSTYDSTESNIMIFQSYTGKENSKKQYKLQTIENNLAYADYTECISNPENKVFVVLNIPIEIAKVNLGDVNSYSVLIKAYDITKCENIKISFPLPNDINLTNYNIYKQNDIDIYNPNGDAFNKICYSNSKLKEDYPLNYRQKKIYSQKQFEGIDEKCLYEEIDIENEMVVMKCHYSENGFGYKYIDNELKETKKNYVPLKCFSLLFKSLKQINKGVKLFGVLLFSMFFSLILSKCCCKEKEDKEIIKNDIENQKDSIEEIKEGTSHIEEERENQITIYKSIDNESGRKKSKKKIKKIKIKVNEQIK